MRQQQRTALALAALLALASSGVAAQTGTIRGASRTPQQAHSAADAGYKAYARRDYAAAMEHARRATQLRPARRDYWLLLAESQLAAGQLEAAEQSLASAAQAKGDDAKLARTRADLGRARAQVAGDAMYKALQAGDVKSAIMNGLSLIHI